MREQDAEGWTAIELPGTLDDLEHTLEDHYWHKHGKHPCVERRFGKGGVVEFWYNPPDGPLIVLLAEPVPQGLRVKVRPIRWVDDETDKTKMVLDRRPAAEKLTCELVDVLRQRGDSTLTWLDRLIIKTVYQIRNEYWDATDERVAARLPPNPGTGKSYSRATINRYRNRLRDMGYKV